MNFNGNFMTDLFQIEESLSPRLAWYREHQVRVLPPEQVPEVHEDVIRWLTDKYLWARLPEPPNCGWEVYIDGDCGTGVTLADALRDLEDQGIKITGQYPDGSENPWPRKDQWTAQSGWRQTVGDTEDEATAAMAAKMGVKHWK